MMAVPVQVTGTQICSWQYSVAVSTCIAARFQSSACTSTVCGKDWLEGYIGSLDMTDKDKIKHGEGFRVFKFGGGTRLKSVGEYELPATIVGKQVTVRTDVVDSDIPLLLSRDAMKKARVKLDVVNDSAEILGEQVPLNITTSGHYCITLRGEVIAVEEVCAVNLSDMTKEERYKTILKLHRQFAHPSEKRLINLMKDAGVWEDEYIKCPDRNT